MRIYYHGGFGGLAVGDCLLPPRETGRGGAGRDDRVYVTTDLLQAVNCALIEQGMVYRVQPKGRLGPDDNGMAGPDYAVRGAVIVARSCLPPRMAAFQYASFDDFHRDVVDLFIALDARFSEGGEI